jgi:hypothetical protein
MIFLLIIIRDYFINGYSINDYCGYFINGYSLLFY